MNPLFILSDVDTNDIFGSKTPPNNYGIYNEEDNNIINQYREFRTNIFRINNYDEIIFNNEIILVYIREISDNFNKHHDVINKLIKNNVFDKDVKSIFFIDIWEDLSSTIDISIYQKINKVNSNIVSNTSAQIFSFILSRENNESKELTISDVYHQIKNLLALLNKNYLDIYHYIKNWVDEKELIFNSFGSSATLLPKSKIEESIFYLNNATQIYYLLTNKKFDKDEFYNISSLRTSLIDKKKIEKLLKDKYSSPPKKINVLNSVNTLYDKCDIDNIKYTFDNTELYPFSDFIANDDKLSIIQIHNTHNDFLLDTTYKTTNATKETEKFFDSAKKNFREYRNDKIILLQRHLNNQKNNKINDLKEIITDYSLNIIKSDSDTIRREFSNDTTSFEVLIDSLLYFASGSEKEDFIHDKNLIETIKRFSKESVIERSIYRRKLFNDFYDKNNLIKENIKKIDDELEDESGKIGFKKLIKQRKQLSYSFINKNIGIFNKDKYSFLLKTTAFSILSSLLFFLLSFYFIGEFYFAILFGLIPVLIGIFIITNQVILFKKHLKYLESLITKKVSLLYDVVSNHDTLVKNYVSEIKKEYSLEIIKETQRHCLLKVYKLKNFRTYMLNNYFLSITKYISTNFETSAFELSLITKEIFEKYFFSFPTQFYFEKYPDKKLNFFNLYLDKSKSDTFYEFQPNPLQLNYFDENENAYEFVEPLPSHKSIAVYHNKFDKNTVLFLSNKHSHEPVVLEDIKQGEIGNCYFMASIGAIAHKRPSYLRNMIIPFDHSENITEEESEVKNESFLVRFFDDKRNEKYVAIDNKFWFYKDSSLNPVYANFGYADSEHYEIWPMILEKAWAKINNGYKKIVGDDPNTRKKQRRFDFGLALSGNYAEYKSIQEFNNNEQITSFITNKLRNNIPLVIYSKEYPKDKSTIGWHAYAIKNIENDKINLYNPHGKNHLNKKSIDFIKENFDAILFFNLEETSELVIPPAEKVKYLDRINEIEEQFNQFFGDELITKIQSVLISEIINNEDFQKILKRVDKSSIPLFHNKNIKKEYLLAFTDIENIDFGILKNQPTESKSKISDDIYLFFTKFVSWNLNI